MNYKNLISRLTLEEKAALLSGKGEFTSRNIDRLGIPSLCFSDGPSGLRHQAGSGDHLGLNEAVPATCFPSSAAVACSWDPELAEKISEAIGEEAAAENVDVLLGPGLNIKRNPLCGRNFEYYSEDPYLSGKLAAGYVRGLQKTGTSACIKHFAVNSQETRRMAMNSVVDERTLREIYLTGFEIAVREGRPGAVMTSYNQVNEIYANENKHLLIDILRSEWGFHGAVITDWGGSNDHVRGVSNGSTLEMPNPGLGSAREIIRAVKEGRLRADAVDDRVDELMTLIFHTKKDRKRYKSFCRTKTGEEMFADHHRLAQEAAEQSAVLLKNEADILPLKPGTKVAVIGDFAYEPRYQGAGSSQINSQKVDSVVSLLDGAGENPYGVQIAGFARGYSRGVRKCADGGKSGSGRRQAESGTFKTDEELRDEAAALARQADVVLLFFGLTENSESEGLDRQHLRIPDNQIELIRVLSEANPNLIGIIAAGSAIEVSWSGHFRALVDMYLAGEAGDAAALNILTGKVCPSGKLAETFPVRYEDVPSASYYPSKERDAEYREGLYVGYRYYETTGRAVAYPFGYGLSYTSFGYRDLYVDSTGVSVCVTNTGKVSGSEIVQLYVGLPCSAIYRPVRELKGFAKVFLKPGETRTVRLPFDEYTFRFWNSKTARWETEEGDYSVQIGDNADDIRLTGVIHREGTLKKEKDGSCNSIELPILPQEIPSYMSGHIENVSDEEYEKILGRAIPDGSWGTILRRNDALCQMKYAKSGIARKIYGKLNSSVEKSLENGTPDLNALFQYNMPFRAIAKMTGGLVSMDMVDGMLDFVNGHSMKGLGKIIGGFFSNLVHNRMYERKLKEISE